MSGTGIEAPYTIAPLPRPLDREHGRIQAAPVFGLGGSRKRKRHEVAVGIDGESVTVYNIQNQNQVTSYALPPRTYLCCAPCSVYCRRTKTASAQRKTYFVAKDRPTETRRRLVCFIENVGGKRTPDVELSAPVRTECKIQIGEIAGIDLVPSASDRQHSVILTYRNGDTLSVDGDLSRTKPLECPQLDSAGEYEVEHVTTIDVESARKGLLKNREDVLALLGQNGTAATGVPLLCHLIRSNHERHLRLYSLRDPHQRIIQSQTPILQLVMSYELHSHKRINTKQDGPHTAEYELHYASGTLYQLLDGRLNIFDLSGTTPKFLTSLGSRSFSVNGFARISASSVLVVSSDSASIHETKYGSVAASINLNTGNTSEAQSKKRKRDDQGLHVIPRMTICTFSSHLGLVAGLAGNELVALQLNDSLRGNKRAKSNVTLLADVIGKGGWYQTHNSDMKDSKLRKWEAWIAKVDALVENDDIEGLEQLVANDFSLGGQKKTKQRRKDSSKKDHANMDETVNGDVTAYEDFWPTRRQVNPQSINRRRVLYVLSKVFTLKDLEEGGLEIRLPSSKLLQWLALIGFLTLPYLRTTLQQSSRSTIMPGDIMAAIRQSDPDFQTMHDLLSLRVHWDIAEVVQALRLLVQSFDARLALPAPPLHSHQTEDLEMASGDDADPRSHSRLEMESLAAELELDHAMSALTTGLEIRSDTLRKVLARLHAFPHSVVSSTLRAMLSHKELKFFIHILRIELADGGWTSKYVDGLLGEEELQFGGVDLSGLEDLQPSDYGIERIGELMNCAIEAIGISGWLVGQSNDVGATEELMENLRAEVSAGVEGCFEADLLATFLEELEQCEWDAEKVQRVRGEKWRLEDGDGVDEETLLPLGPPVEPVVGWGKNENGGRKSHLAFAREQGQSVGKYSFERIRI